MIILPINTLSFKNKRTLIKKSQLRGYVSPAEIQKQQFKENKRKAIKVAVLTIMLALSLTAGYFYAKKFDVIIKKKA